jgi:hypothetical protein
MSASPVGGYLARIELRRTWRSVLLLGGVVAVVTATVLASLAGAERSQSAFDRYLDVVDPPDAMAFGNPEDRAALASIEGAEATVEIDLVAAFPEIEDEDFFPLVVAEDGTVPYDRMSAPVIEGRLPAREEPYEVALGERTAERLDAPVGSTVTIATFTPEGWAAIEEDETAEFAPDGPRLDLEVVGIVRDPGDIAARGSDITLTFLSPAFRAAHPVGEIGSLDHGTFVFLRPGVGLDHLTDAVQDRDIELDTAFFSASNTMNPTLRSIATALRVFALVVALAGLIAIWQSIARMQQAAWVDDAALGAIGTGRGARWARLFLPGALAVAGGAAVGLVAAIPASTVFPVGLARRADPALGIDVDTGTLLVGALCTLAVLGSVVGVLAAWRVRRSQPGAGSTRVPRWRRATADLGAPAPAVTGLALASGTPGRPSGIALVGTLLSVAGIVAALVFSASTDRLREDPQLYGWGWDAVVESPDISSLDAPEGVAARLAEDDRIQATGVLLTQLPVTIGGSPDFVTAVVPHKGDLSPVIAAGDAPIRTDEVALGRESLRAIGADVGDTVEVRLGSASSSMRVSGVAVMPVSADGGSSASGVFLSPTALDPSELDAACHDSDSCSSTVAVSLREGVDLETWAGDYEDPEAFTNVALPSPPGEVDRLTAVEDLPKYLAGFLAVLAAVAVSFAVATTVRQRRRDLAVLRALGMTGRQVRAVVAVLVTAMTAGGALLGAGLGLVLGRQVWRAVADSVSMPFSPSLPLLATVAVTLAAVLLAQVVATGGRRAAARIPAARVLRAE